MVSKVVILKNWLKGSADHSVPTPCEEGVPIEQTTQASTAAEEIQAK